MGVNLLKQIWRNLHKITTDFNLYTKVSCRQVCILHRSKTSLWYISSGDTHVMPIDTEVHATSCRSFDANHITDIHAVQWRAVVVTKLLSVVPDLRPSHVPCGTGIQLCQWWASVRPRHGGQANLQRPRPLLTHAVHSHLPYHTWHIINTHSSCVSHDHCCHSYSTETWLHFFHINFMMLQQLLPTALAGKVMQSLNIHTSISTVTFVNRPLTLTFCTCMGNDQALKVKIKIKVKVKVMVRVRVSNVKQSVVFMLMHLVWPQSSHGGSCSISFSQLTSFFWCFRVPLGHLKATKGWGCFQHSWFPFSGSWKTESPSKICLNYIQRFLLEILYPTRAFSALGLQCFDAVGWAAGRASGL